MMKESTYSGSSFHQEQEFEVEKFFRNRGVMVQGGRNILILNENQKITRNGLPEGVLCSLFGYKGVKLSVKIEYGISFPSPALHSPKTGSFRDKNRTPRCFFPPHRHPSISDKFFDLGFFFLVKFRSGTGTFLRHRALILLNFSVFRDKCLCPFEITRVRIQYKINFCE